MIILIKAFLDICWFRTGPQSVPASKVLLAFTLVTYGISSLSISLAELPFFNAVLSSVVDVLLLVGLAIASLWIGSLPERRMQTLTALAGTGTVLQVIAWPIVIWLTNMDSGQVESQMSLASILMLGLVVWNILIIGHILRHALSLSFPMGVGIALVYIFISFRIARLLFIAA